MGRVPKDDKNAAKEVTCDRCVPVEIRSGDVFMFNGHPAAKIAHGIKGGCRHGFPFVRRSLTAAHIHLRFSPRPASCLLRELPKPVLHPTRHPHLQASSTRSKTRLHRGCRRVSLTAA